MDEELVIWYWDQSPEEVGEFDYTSLEDFDQWLLQSERNLDQILPEKKGIVALRVRRNPKSRDWSPERVMEKIHAEEQDRMVYLLVRNGENLYRLWVNVQIWPRFFPRLDEWDPSEEDREWRKHDRKEKEEKARKYVAGLLVVQGLVERSPLFHPLPDQNIDSFNPDHADKYFHLVRNDEVTLALSDGDPLYRITWDGYFEWLQEKVEVGVRVMWLHRPYHDCKLSDRVYMRSVSAWPESDSVYVLDEGGKSRYSAPFSFLYLPDEEIYRREVGLWSSREVVVKRVKRVRFQCYPDELWPVDYLSWRVLHHLLHDRSQREYYSKYLWKIHYLHKWCLKEVEAERPFIDLVLSRVGLDPRDCLDSDRARVERLSRWWKLKTKEHRSVSTDDAKALRMVVRAFKSGKDFEDDPERSLLASMS
jgi:hypothetical protein